MNFWYQDPTFLIKLFKPFSMLYPTLAKLSKLFAKPYHSKKKVVCIGNVVAGGSGKTPVVIALAKQLQEQGFRVNILSRGYGGSLDGPILVDPQIHKSGDVGDEPLLLCKAAPTWICKSRLKGVKHLENIPDIDIILLDDGLQNPSVYKDYSYLIIGASQGIGNGLCLPFGPLREPLNWATSKADDIIIVGRGSFKIDGSQYVDYQYENAVDFKDKEIIAFAGIGFPKKFYDSLIECGAKVVYTKSFPDHHPYKYSDFTDLLKYKLPLVTTAKDFVRLPDELKNKVQVLNLNLGRIGITKLPF